MTTRDVHHERRTRAERIAHNQIRDSVPGRMRREGDQDALVVTCNPQYIVEWCSRAHLATISEGMRYRGDYWVDNPVLQAHYHVSAGRERSRRRLALTRAKMHCELSELGVPAASQAVFLRVSVRVRVDAYPHVLPASAGSTQAI